MTAFFRFSYFHKEIRQITNILYHIGPNSRKNRTIRKTTNQKFSVLNLILIMRKTNGKGKNVYPAKKLLFKRGFFHKLFYRLHTGSCRSDIPTSAEINIPQKSININQIGKISIVNRSSADFIKSFFRIISAVIVII